MALKKAAKKKTPVVPEKFSLVDQVLTGIMEVAEVSAKGEIKLKKTDVKLVLEQAFEVGALAAAAGQRVKFPIIGTLSRKDVEARKAGKGTNPFTGEPMVIKARPASKKPRWTFPATLKEIFANKKHW